MSNNLPIGYRFYPTEEELLSFYLQNKLARLRESDIERVIPVVDIYQFDPWQLPDMSCGEACVEQWIFFCPLQQREANGGRPARITPSGYWKATGSPSAVFSPDRAVAIGVKKTMVFYLGRAPKGKKTKWKMNEYRAIEGDGNLVPGQVPKLRNEFSVCRMYKNLGCLRSFDRRPVPSISSTNRTADEALTVAGTFGDINISGVKRRRSADGLSAGDDDGRWNNNEAPNEGTIDPMLLEEFDWSQIEWD